MHVERCEDGKQVTIYPNVKTGKVFDANSEPATLITANARSVTLLHRRVDTNGRWNMVQHPAMSKDELQEYIRELLGVYKQLQ